MSFDFEIELQQVRAIRDHFQREALEETVETRALAKRHPVGFFQLIDIEAYLHALPAAKAAGLIDMDCDCRFCQTQPLIIPK